jgi:formate dehydrogenase subunit delta
MNTDHLVHMANRIGEFFEAMPDRAGALEGIADHIRKFWAPRMRVELGEHLERTHGQGLLPIVKEALTSHAEVLKVH